MYYINVLLKDGTYLSNMVIYPSINSNEYPISNKNQIHNKFLYKSDEIKHHSDFMKELIPFQTLYINGKFHPQNVKWYEIVESESEIK